MPLHEDEGSAVISPPSSPPPSPSSSPPQPAATRAREATRSAKSASKPRFLNAPPPSADRMYARSEWGSIRSPRGRIKSVGTPEYAVNKAEPAYHGRGPKWRNWQTRRTQNPVPFGECGFDSHLRHRD